MDVESSPIYSHATILDPRFKTQGFRIKVKAQIAKSTLISDTHEETRTPEPDNQDSGQTEQPAVSTEQTEESWGDVLFEPASTDDSGSEAADEGVRRTYKGADWCILEGAAAGRGKDPLKWWDSNQKEYPLLVDHARKYLGIPGSSAASEGQRGTSNRQKGSMSHAPASAGLESSQQLNKNKVPLAENIAQEPET